LVYGFLTFEKVIGTNALVSHGISNHVVSELVDVTRSPEFWLKGNQKSDLYDLVFLFVYILKNFFGSDVGAIDFEHVFGKHEVFAPEGKQVGLHTTTRGTVVVETSDT